MPLPFAPVAVLFDMDGLLFDTETVYLEAFLAASERGRYGLDEDHFRRTVGGTWETNKALLIAMGVPADQFRADWHRECDRIGTHQAPMKAGAVEMLATLDELGLPRAIATSSRPDTVAKHLTFHGLTDRFHAIVAQGDYEKSKPAPDPYLLAAQRLGVAPERCLALEDSHNGVRSASAAGTMTVMVPDLLPATDEIRALCTSIAEDLHAVRRLLLTALGL